MSPKNAAEMQINRINAMTVITRGDGETGRRGDGRRGDGDRMSIFQFSPSNGARASRNFIIPSRVRVLTVPRGRFNFSAISL
jgi:hypothetical protein